MSYSPPCLAELRAELEAAGGDILMLNGGQAATMTAHGLGPLGAATMMTGQGGAMAAGGWQVLIRRPRAANCCHWHPSPYLSVNR